LRQGGRPSRSTSRGRPRNSNRCDYFRRWRIISCARFAIFSDAAPARDPVHPPAVTVAPGVWCLCPSRGRQRGNHFRAFGVSAFSALQAESLHPLSPLTLLLNRGVMD
jgi:hypothetical protein